MKNIIASAVVVLMFASAITAEVFEVLDDGKELILMFKASDPVEVGRALKSYLVEKNLIVYEYAARNFSHSRDKNGTTTFSFPMFFRGTEFPGVKAQLKREIKFHLEQSFPEQPASMNHVEQAVLMLTKVMTTPTMRRAVAAEQPASKSGMKLLDKATLEALFPHPEGHLEVFEADCKATLEAAIIGRQETAISRDFGDLRFEDLFPKLEKWAFETHGVQIRSIDYKSPVVFITFVEKTKGDKEIELQACAQLISSAVRKLSDGQDGFVDLKAYNLAMFPYLVESFEKFAQQGFILGKEIVPVGNKNRAIFVLRRLN